MKRKLEVPESIKNLSDEELYKILDESIAFDAPETKESVDLMDMHTFAYVELKEREAARKAV